MAQARIETKFDSMPARLLLSLSRHRATVAAGVGALLHLAARQADAECRHRDQGRCAPSQRKLARGAGSLAFWSETGLERAHLLHTTEKLLDEEGWKFSLDTRLDELGHARLRQPLVEPSLRSMSEIYRADVA